MKGIIVLGAGLVGGPMALDLAGDEGFDITVADVHEAALTRLMARATASRLTTRKADLSDRDELSALVANFDMVVNALPGFMGFETLRTVIEAGKDVVDIAFFPEDPFDLHDLAIENGVTAVMDCGVAPGMSNLLAAHSVSRLDSADTILIYVGGLPEVRQGPWEYKAVFSPADVIEEYSRPARYIENGQMVIRPALSEPELCDFPGIGTLEAFNSDGLRTLADTLDVRNMKEKTLRYPGHIDKVAALRDTGFFSKEPIEVGGVKIVPLDFTSSLLFHEWEMKPGEGDITVMQIITEGMKEGKRTRIVYDLLDRFDAESDIHSMARTTGYTATMTVRLLSEGLYSEKGISPPEHIGWHPECVEFILEGLRKRGVEYRETITTL
ncbi:saccharopine dehydrogenase family protein [Gemmatimonadota bacterium]